MSADDFIYTVHTDLPPQWVDRIGLMIFTQWLEFALGQRALGGNRIVYPTGKYAASIKFRREGEATVAIIADPTIAPEAMWLERGHGPIDLKKLLTPGRGYPRHRLKASAKTNSLTGLARVGRGKAPSTTGQAQKMIGGGPTMWARAKAREATGFASFGPNSAPDSWIIPPMRAYSPAYILSEMAGHIASVVG